MAIHHALPGGPFNIRLPHSAVTGPRTIALYRTQPLEVLRKGGWLKGFAPARVLERIGVAMPKAAP